MTVYRINKQERFTQIDNRMINDSNISAKAKGILLYLLSKPNDWKVYEVDITNNMKDGKDSINSGIKELITAGYIHRARAHDERGRFAGYEYTVYEHNTDNPHFTISGKSVNGKSVNGKPENGKTVNGESATTNTKLTNTDLTKTELREEEEEAPSAEQLLEQQAQKAFRFYEQHFGMLNPSVTNKIDMWLNEFDVTAAGDILCYAMEQAAERQKQWPYAQSILKDWAQRNARTLNDVKALQEEFKRKKGGKPNGSNENGHGKIAGADAEFYNKLRNFNS